MKLKVSKAPLALFKVGLLVSIFPIPLCSMFLPVCEADLRKYRFIPYDIYKDYGAGGGAERWYTHLGLRDTFNAKGISGTIHIRENDIDSANKDDFVLFALTLVRFVDGHKEGFEVGYYQDHSGYWFFTGWIIQDEFYLGHRSSVIPESLHTLRLAEVDNVFFAYIDGDEVDYGEFSEDVSEDKIYACQGESSDPTNEMRGQFSNLLYYKCDGTERVWSNVLPFQSAPYYTRLCSTDGYHTTILGDISVDYYVDSLDVALISCHWYCPPFPSGPLGYADKADINHDGLVNILDVAYINIYWHQGW